MRNHELTINGLTKSAARQLGQAYFTVAESMEMIDELSASNATAAREFAKLSMEAAGLRHANASLKRRIKTLETGEFQDPQEQKAEDAADAVGYALEVLSERDPLIARIGSKIPAKRATDPNDIPLPELDNHSRNEVNEMAQKARERVRCLFGEGPTTPEESTGV